MHFSLNSLLFFPQIMTAHECPLTPLVKILLHLAKHCFPEFEKFEARMSLFSVSPLTLYVRNKDIFCQLYISMIKEDEMPLASLPFFMMMSPLPFIGFKFLFVCLFSNETNSSLKKSKKK